MTEKAKTLIATGRSTYREHLGCIEQRKKTHVPEQHVQTIAPDAASSVAHNRCYCTSNSFALDATSYCVTAGSHWIFTVQNEQNQSQFPNSQNY